MSDANVVHFPSLSRHFPPSHCCHRSCCICCYWKWVLLHFPTRKITFLRSTAVMWLLFHWLSPLSPHLIYGIRCLPQERRQQQQRQAASCKILHIFGTRLQQQEKKNNNNHGNDIGNCRCGLFCRPQKWKCGAELAGGGLGRRLEKLNANNEICYNAKSMLKT